MRPRGFTRGTKKRIAKIKSPSSGQLLAKQTKNNSKKKLLNAALDMALLQAEEKNSTKKEGEEREKLRDQNTLNKLPLALPSPEIEQKNQKIYQPNITLLSSRLYSSESSSQLGESTDESMMASRIGSFFMTTKKQSVSDIQPDEVLLSATRTFSQIHKSILYTLRDNPEAVVANWKGSNPETIIQEIENFLYPEKTKYLYYYPSSQSKNEPNYEGCEALISLNYRLALDWFQIAIDNQVSDLCTDFGSAISLFEIGEPTKAIQLLLKYRQNCYSLYNLAVFSIQQQNFSKCIEYCDQALFIFQATESSIYATPDFAFEILEMRCFACFQLGRLTEAAQDYLRAMKTRNLLKVALNMRNIVTFKSTQERKYLEIARDYNSEKLYLQKLECEWQVAEPYRPSSVCISALDAKPKSMKNNPSNDSLFSNAILQKTDFVVKDKLCSTSVNHISSLLSQCQPKRAEFVRPQKLINVEKKAPAFSIHTLSQQEFASLYRPQSSGTPHLKKKNFTEKKQKERIISESFFQQIPIKTTWKYMEKEIIDQIVKGGEDSGQIVSTSINQKKIARQEERTQRHLRYALRRIGKLHERFHEETRILNAPSIKKDHSGSLSTKNLLFIKEELEKPVKDNIDALDSMVRKMFFFAKFGVAERKKLLSAASYVFFYASHTIFSQGDIGDYMYIILKGTVMVKINNPTPGKEPILVATLRDGDNFGELAVLSTTKDPGRRRASCICFENCHMIRIHTTTVQETVQQLISITLKGDIKVMQNTVYFSHLMAHELFPILCNIRKRTFSYGEFIVREGEVPECMYIVRRGICSLCLESIGFRSIVKKKFSKNDPSTLFAPDSKTLEAQKDLKTHTRRGFKNTIIYTDEKGKVLRNHIMYQNLHIIGTLEKYSTFGGSVLLPTEFSSEKNSSVLKYDSMPSLMSVVADSAEVEIFYITHPMISYLTKAQYDQFMRVLREQIDPLRPLSTQELEELKANFCNWEKYKMALTEEILRKQRLQTKCNTWGLRETMIE